MSDTILEIVIAIAWVYGIWWVCMAVVRSLYGRAESSFFDD